MNPPHNPRETPALPPILTDTRTLRERARQGLADGAVTAGYGPLRDEVLALLDGALATELVCMLRYRRHHFMACGVLSKPVADEFLVHATQESQHADWLAERIAIDAYREGIAFLGDSDPTTRRLLGTILATEEEHADELASLLQVLPADARAVPEAGVPAQTQ